MRRALIGHTGFVGGNLAAQRPFEATYNTTNVEAIAGERFDLLVCAGAPGTKWLANREPERDRASIERLMRALERTSAARCVLISTVDVFPEARGVDETSPVAKERAEPYGRHRRELEEFVAARFPSHLVVRLPGLFGKGLKKNAVFDLLHGQGLERIPSDGHFQFYDLGSVSDDVETALAAGLALVHFATEPVTIAEVARHAFGRAFENPFGARAPAYDLRTRHAAVFGKTGSYLATRKEVLERIAEFVRRARA